jgi:hypothetical protein
MNGLEKHGLDEGNFGAKGNIVSAFDAFRMLLSLVPYYTFLNTPTNRDSQLNPNLNMLRARPAVENGPSP